jgi:hypothetical protein
MGGIISRPPPYLNQEEGGYPFGLRHSQSQFAFAGSQSQLKTISSEMGLVGTEPRNLKTMDSPEREE